MTGRRKNLLWLLALLLLMPVVVGLFGGVGSYELLVWFVLVVAWAAAFSTWGRRPTGPS